MFVILGLFYNLLFFHVVFGSKISPFRLVSYVGLANKDVLPTILLKKF